MASAAIIGGAGSPGSGCSSTWIHVKDRKRNSKTANRVKVSCSSTSSVTDPYRTLKIRPGASESEVKKAFRRLALQYHPDVCRGSSCNVQFQTINEAYDCVMNQLRRQYEEMEMYEDGMEESMIDPDYDMWEEWMGWEGAGIRDYTSHINPYI